MSTVNLVLVCLIGIIAMIIGLPWLIEQAAYVFGRGVARGKIEATREAFTSNEDDEVKHDERK